MMKPESVFVLGVSGLIGSACCNVFLEKGFVVYGFSRSKPINIINKENNFTLFKIDLIEKLDEFLNIYSDIKPCIIIVATGNHNDDSNNTLKLYKLHVELLECLYKIYNEKFNERFCSIVFCSSLMAYIPDRRYPYYAAIKAGLNQYILSLNIEYKSNCTISGIVLGPVSKKHINFFTVTPEKVANKIYQIATNPKKKLYFFPLTNKIISVLFSIFPIWFESITFKFRRPL